MCLGGVWSAGRGPDGGAAVSSELVAGGSRPHRQIPLPASPQTYLQIFPPHHRLG